MSRDPLHDFQELRTRPPIPPELPPKPRCEKCDAVLRTGNDGSLCAPCGLPDGFELPGWAVELAENAKPADLAPLAKLMREVLGLVEVADPEAPLCACGCGEQTLRYMAGGSNGGHRLTTGPYQTYLAGHWRGNRGNGGKYRREGGDG